MQIGNEKTTIRIVLYWTAILSLLAIAETILFFGMVTCIGGGIFFLGVEAVYPWWWITLSFVVVGIPMGLVIFKCVFWNRINEIQNWGKERGCEIS